MLTSDKLILVELHKVGSTRLKKLVGDLVGGETSSKQSAYSDELAAMGKPVVGYLCNPLTWYLAQWKLGCAGKGEFHKRLTDETKWDLLRSKRAQLPPKNAAAKPDAKALPDGWGAARAKDFWYADANDPQAFREWLQAVAAHRGLRRLVDHGYNNSPICRLGGLMTYQFLLMFVRNAENMEKSVDSMEALEARYQQQAITSHFIRAEAISEDLKKVLDALHVPLNSEQRAAVDGLKERSGAQEAAIIRFYDPASLRLIAKREALINKLFDYGPPTAEARAVARATKTEALEGDAKGAKGEGPKLSKAEKERKRQARAERQAAKAAKAARKEAGGDKKEKPAKAPDADQPTKADKPAKADKKTDKSAAAPKPEKLKRVKSRPLDEDVIETGE
jgi:hypothetical protein